MFDEKKCEIINIVNIEVGEDELLKRATFRAETSDRKDDKDANIHKKRIENNSFETFPEVSGLKI